MKRFPSRQIKQLAIFSATLMCSLLLTACATPITRADVPQGLSPAVMLQRAQEFVDRGEFENATVYLEEFASRYPDDTARIAEAEYLKAHFLFKTKKYTEAKVAFEALLAKISESESSYPQWVAVLSRRLLQNINSKLAILTPESKPGSTNTTSSQQGESLIGGE